MAWPLLLNHDKYIKQKNKLTNEKTSCNVSRQKLLQISTFKKVQAFSNLTIPK